MKSICIPFGYIPPNPEVSIVSSKTKSASVGIYINFNVLLLP